MDHIPWEHLRNYAGPGDVRRFFEELRGRAQGHISGRSRRKKPQEPNSRNGTAR